jgi:hypothetical protein
MLRSVCLIRRYLGVVTRIECEVRPLAGGQGSWVVLCAAGLDAEQPSMVNLQGPFCGPCMAQEILCAIIDSLLAQGYQQASSVAIWRLHLQAQIRLLQGPRPAPLGSKQTHPKP